MEIPFPFYAAFSGYEALKGPKEISGFEGDTVSLQCTYEMKMKEHRKYWCRRGGILVPRCRDIVYTSQDQEVTRGMMSIRDSPQELSMTVTIRNLTLKDSGSYWCGIDRLGFDESFEVTLIVFPGNEQLSSPSLGVREIERSQGMGKSIRTMASVSPLWKGAVLVPISVSTSQCLSRTWGVSWDTCCTGDNLERKPQCASALASLPISSHRAKGAILVILGLDMLRETTMGWGQDDHRKG